MFGPRPWSFLDGAVADVLQATAVVAVSAVATGRVLCAALRRRLA